MGNLLLDGLAKYLLLTGVLALACALYRREIATLWTTARQVLSGLLRRRAGNPPRT